MRNRLIHEYFSTNTEKGWRVIKSELPLETNAIPGSKSLSDN